MVLNKIKHSQKISKMDSIPKSNAVNLPRGYIPKPVQKPNLTETSTSIADHKRNTNHFVYAEQAAVVQVLNEILFELKEIKSKLK